MPKVRPTSGTGTARWERMGPVWQVMGPLCVFIVVVGTWSGTFVKMIPTVHETCNCLTAYNLFLNVVKWRRCALWFPAQPHVGLTSQLRWLPPGTDFRASLLSESPTVRHRLQVAKVFMTPNSVSLRFCPSCFRDDPSKTQLAQWHSQQGSWRGVGATNRGSYRSPEAITTAGQNPRWL